jgi:hypothetical protein
VLRIHAGRCASLQSASLSPYRHRSACVAVEAYCAAAFAVVGESLPAACLAPLQKRIASLGAALLAALCRFLMERPLLVYL